MKIRQKLLLSYLLLVALFIAAGATITYNTMKMSELQNNVRQQVEINDNAYAYAQGLDQKQFGTIMYTMEDPQKGEQIMVSSAEAIVAAQDYLRPALANDPALLTKFNEVVDLDWNTINPAITRISEIYHSTTLTGDEQVGQIWVQLSILMTAVSQADTKLAEVRAATMANVQAATVASQNYASFSTLLAVGFIAATTAVSVAMAVTMGNRITRPLKKLADIAHKVSLGDLNQRHYLKENVDIKTGDEIDELVDAFKRMINAFRMTEALVNEPEVEIAQ
jgi:nitrogen fixation/metabolism regulation signal transduction histidine kinase